MVKVAATIALLSVSVWCLSAAYQLRVIEKHLAATTMAVGDTLAKVNLELDEMHRLTLEAGLTAMEARKASKKESEYLDKWNTQLAQVMTDVHSVMQETAGTVASIQPVTAAATSTLQTTQATVAQLQAPIAQANADFAQLQAPIAQLNVDLQALQPAINHTDATMDHVAATTADVQQAVHSYLHPTWPQRILGWVKTGVVTVGQIVF
jgi:chromosome segregation ATPase